MRIAVVPAGLFFIAALKSCNPAAPKPPQTPVHDVAYDTLDSRQKSLFQTYPNVTAANASAYWMSPLNLSQRVEFAGGTQAVELEVEKAAGLQAVTAVTGIHGSEPNAPSQDQFNTDVIWDKDTPERVKNLPHWSEHIALLHPGQHGYQENRDGNPFLGLVVLFDENSANPTQTSGQFHIDFRSLFGHYEPENGDIGNPDNYKLFTSWYGNIDSFEPLP